MKKKSQKCKRFFKTNILINYFTSFKKYKRKTSGKIYVMFNTIVIYEHVMEVKHCRMSGQIQTRARVFTYTIFPKTSLVN